MSRMPPRLSVRRFFLWLVLCGGCLLLVLLYQNREYLDLHVGTSSELSEDPTSILTTRTNTNAPVLNTESTKVDKHIPAVRERKRDEDRAQQQQQSVENSEGSLLGPKQWYFAGGTEYPEKTPPGGPRAKLFPDEESGDRITNQLMHIPDSYEGYDTAEKVILAYNGLGQWYKKAGGGAFHGCPVNRCTLTDDKSRAGDADAIIYKDHFTNPGVPRPPSQIWMLYFLECPYHTQNVKQPDVFNWTATYRTDSTLVAPYEKWTYYDNNQRYRAQNINYATNKTKKVAWFVSNCGSRNGRLAYARELAKHIQVDIYGTCGTLHCPRSDRKCFEILDRDYKFYLAFENSNCRDYVTEKLFVNGLGHNVLPVVMGGRPEDYERTAPENSYIHVDEFSGPKELAEYLKRLDENDELYNSYFRWKGTGEFINTYFWCRLCTMLHAQSAPRHYEDVNDWWRGPGVCTLKSWRTADGGKTDARK